jgi:hypothetical protein
LTIWRGDGSILVRQHPVRSGAFLDEAIRFSSRLSRNRLERQAATLRRLHGAMVGVG